MFDFSFSELLFIVAVAIIVLKPEDLPIVMKNLGKMARKIKDFTNNIFQEFELEAQKPRTKKILGDDGKYYQAYSLEDVFEENLSENSENISKNGNTNHELDKTEQINTEK